MITDRKGALRAQDARQFLYSVTIKRLPLLSDSHVRTTQKPVDCCIYVLLLFLLFRMFCKMFLHMVPRDWSVLLVNDFLNTFYSLCCLYLGSRCFNNLGGEHFIQKSLLLLLISVYACVLNSFLLCSETMFDFIGTHLQYFKFYNFIRSCFRAHQ